MPEQELLQDDNIIKTRMDEENIARVFTPSLMRCSTLSNTSLLDNIEKEKNFIKFLISSCDLLLDRFKFSMPFSPY